MVVRHIQRVERPGPEWGQGKRIRTVDPPYEEIVLLTAREERQPGRARIDQLAVALGDTVTVWQGREPATMRLECPFDALWIPGQSDVEAQIGFFHRLTGPGRPGGLGVAIGRRIALNFGHGQDHTWWVESCEITLKARNRSGRTTQFVATLELIQATAPILALSPVEIAVQRTG